MKIRDSRRFNFTIIENDIIDDIEAFDKNDLLCYMALCRYANNETGECFPSYKTIAKTMRVGVSTAVKAIKSLSEKGVIKIENRKDDEGGSSSNLYTILGFTGKEKALTLAEEKGTNKISTCTNSICDNDTNNTSNKEKNEDVKTVNEIIDILESNGIRNVNKKEAVEIFADVDKLVNSINICKSRDVSGYRYLVSVYNNYKEVPKHEYIQDGPAIKFTNNFENTGKDEGKPGKSNENYKKTNFHNFEETFTKYSNDELEDITLKQQYKHDMKNDADSNNHSYEELKLMAIEELQSGTTIPVNEDSCYWKPKIEEKIKEIKHRS